MVALLRHPDSSPPCAADPALMPRAIEELMRYDAPVPHSTFRFATESVEIAGVTIPAARR